jgi:hypothetical protein
MPIDSIARLSAREIVRLLDLQPLSRGEHFGETFRDPALDASGGAW